MGMQDILINIRSIFARKGTDDAKAAIVELNQSTRAGADALDANSAAAKKNADATSKGAAAAINGRDGFAVMGAAAAASTGNIQGVASSMAQLLPKLQALQTALPVAGLALAAFTAWKRVFDLLEGIRESQERGLREITAGNMAAGVDAIAESFRRMTKEIDDAYDAQNALLGHIDAMTRASQRNELAEMRQRKELDSRGVTDPDAKAKIDSRYALLEAQMREAWAKGDAMRQEAALQNQAERAIKTLEDERVKQDEIQPRMLAADRAKRRTEELQLAAPDKKKGAFDAEIEKLAKVYEDLNGQMKASGEVVEAASKELKAALARLTELDAIRGATAAENRAAIMGAEGAVRAADPAFSAQDARFRREIDAREARIADLKRQTENLDRNAEKNVDDIAGYIRDIAASQRDKMQALADEILNIKNTMASQPGG